MNKYDKKIIVRDVGELMSNMNDILLATSKDYVVRIKRFLNKIQSSPILSEMFSPYFDMKLEDGKYGLHNTGYGYNVDYLVPENEDEEIACLLQDFRLHIESKGFLNIFLLIYHENTRDANISRFNDEIVRPCFDKIERKLRYKLEDIDEIEGKEVDSNIINIININNASYSNIAIGDSNIQQIIEFDELINELNVNEEIENDVKDELLSILNEIKKNTCSKKNAIISIMDFLIKFSEQYKILKPIILKIIDFILKLK